MKYFYTIMVAVVFTGCGQGSSEYKEFVEAYGSDTRLFCDDGFLMRETFKSSKATAPQLFLVNSQECKEK